MKTRKRVGSVVPCENVDPHTGSFLDYGVIVGWQDTNGNSCSRSKSAVAIVEMTGKKVGDWTDWCEEHCWKLDPFAEGLAT